MRSVTPSPSSAISTSSATRSTPGASWPWARTRRPSTSSGRPVWTPRCARTCRPERTSPGPRPAARPARRARHGPSGDPGARPDRGRRGRRGRDGRGPGHLRRHAPQHGPRCRCDPRPARAAHPPSPAGSPWTRSASDATGACSGSPTPCSATARARSSRRRPWTCRPWTSGIARRVDGRGRNVLHAPADPDLVIDALREALLPATRERIAGARPTLADGRAGQRIADIIAAWRPPRPPRKRPITVPG